MKKQLLEEFNLRLAAIENEITTLQNQITNLSQPTCTNDELAQIKMLVSKFPISTSKMLNIYMQHSYKLQTYSNNLSTKGSYEDNKT